MMSKTIAKAYEALKGDLSNSYQPVPHTDRSLFFSADHRGYFCSSSERDVGDGSQFICTVDEFNNYKPQKTVVDAVNEFKGVWPLLISLNSDWWYCSPTAIRFKSESSYFSYAEFDVKVKGMSHHAGHELYERYVRSAKTPLTKETKVDYTSLEFWKDAPDDMSKFGSIGISGEEVFYNNTRYCYEKSGKDFPFNTENECTFDFNEVTLIATRPKPSPVFTKAMSDAGALPQVGMMVIDKRNNCEYEILLTADTNGYYVMQGYDGSYHCELLKYLKPIDTRTDKEKADDKMRESLEDGKAYQFDYQLKGVRVGVYNKREGKFILSESSIYTVYCTNIQPLTVEVK